MLRKAGIILFLFTVSNLPTFGQSLDIVITKGTDLDFTFNTIRQYVNGVITPNATEFHITSSSEWDLYVGTQTITPGEWDIMTSYSSAGDSQVPVSILEIRATSPGGTSQQTSFFPLQDISNPVYLIGSAADDVFVFSGVGANQPGDPSSNAFTHRFRIDYKLTPGVDYQPGVYGLTIVFTLAEDL